MRRRSFILGSFAAGLGAAISGLPFGSPSAWAAIEPADILADIKPTHPRVAGVDDWAAMRARIAGDPRTSAWYDGVKAKATTNLSAPLAPFGTFDGVRLDVDVVMERLFAWALVAAVSEDTAQAMERSTQTVEGLAEQARELGALIEELGGSCKAALPA